MTKNILSVKDIKTYSTVELLYKLANQTVENSTIIEYLVESGLTNEVVDRLNQMVEDGTIEKLINDSILKEIQDKISHVSNYEKTNNPSLSNGSIMLDGFTQFNKKTYGRYDTATVVSIIGNQENGFPQVLGANSEGLATYTNRDCVSLYVENRKPTHDVVTNLTYTSTGVVMNNGVNENVKIGSILDTDGTVNNDWYVGVVAEIDYNTNTVKLEDGWWLVRNDGKTPTKGIPSNKNLKINWINKVWNINSNLFIPDDCPSGANLELGVLCNHGNINDVGGIDLINMGDNATHYGVKVRGKNKAFNHGYVSNGNGIGYYNKDGVTSFQTEKGSHNFNITAEGCMSSHWGMTVGASSNYTIPFNNVEYVVVQKDGITITLPNGKSGRCIKIIAPSSINTFYVVAPNGVGHVRVDGANTQTQTYCKTNKSFMSLEYFSDGASWYCININV